MEAGIGLPTSIVVTQLTFYVGWVILFLLNNFHKNFIKIISTRS